jgi:hypothetical protein
VTPSDLVRSGWWVVVAAVGVLAGILILLVRPSGAPDPVDVRAELAVDPALASRDDAVRAMARDGLVALTDPPTMTPAEVELANSAERGKLLVPSDRLIGVFIDGEARAYPLRLLRWHEAVNDTVGGRPITVTYCPLSDAAAVWDRIDEPDLELAVSGWLLDSDTLLYDRRQQGEPSNLWHQLTGRAVAGPAAASGHRLTPLPAAIATWQEWRQRYPDTVVMAPDPASKPLYKRDPYHSYRGSDVLRFPVDPLPPDGVLARKDPVAIVTTPEGDSVFALRYLADAVGSPYGTWAAPIGRDVYLLSFDADAGTITVEPRDPDTPPPAVRVASWFAWYAADPTTVPGP